MDTRHSVDIDVLNMHFLHVEDDADIAEFVKSYLEKRNFTVDHALLGSAALELLKTNSYDLCVLDLNLPDIDGLDLVKIIGNDYNIPVIVVSSQGDTTEKSIGIELGASDYIAKPFDPRELLARIRNQIKIRDLKPSAAPAQSQEAKSMRLCNGWSLSLSNRKLYTADNVSIELTDIDFNLLKTFLENPNRVLSRDQLLSSSDQNYRPAFDRSIDNRVSRLRNKFKQYGDDAEFIQTVRGVGYMYLV